MAEERGVLVLRITAVLFLLIGVFLGVGGGWLLALGGSPYYLVAGILTGASGALLWLRNPWGATVYELTATATLLWAFWEAGMDGWALFPRVALPFLLAVWLFTPWVRHALHPERDQDEDERRGSPKGAAAAVVLALLAGVALSVPQLWAAGAPGDDEPEVDGDWAHA